VHVIGGGYTGTTQLGSFTLTAANLRLPFIAKFDVNGNYLNAFNYIQTLPQTDALCMAADGNDHYYVGGKLPSSTVPVFSCTPAPANTGFYLGSLTEQPDSVPTPVITLTNTLLTATPAFGGTIQWYVNDSLLAGENGQTLTVSQNGNYSVVYTYTTGCVGSDTSLMQTVTLSSINSNSDSKMISLSPNPSNGMFRINGLDINNGSISVSVRNVVGSTIFHSSGLYINQSINISDASQGIYFVEVMYNETITIFKVLKQ